MTKQDILNSVTEIAKHVSRDNLNRYLKNHYSEIWNFIHEKTQKLDKFAIIGNKNKQISIFERLYCIEHNLDDRPLCCKCHKEYVNGFNKQTNKYRKWCSPSCQASDITCIEKSKHTKEIYYGNATYNGAEKAAQTRIKRYGSFHSSDFSDKVKATKLKNHGSYNYTNVKLSKQTKLLRYGDETYNNKLKNRNTRKSNVFKKLLDNIYVEPMFSCDEYVKANKYDVFKWKCKKCGNIFSSSLNYNFRYEKKCPELIVRCINCFPRKEIRISNEEQYVFNFIKSSLVATNIQIFKNNRNILQKQELDIWIPEKKLAIEFDGLYWHSDEYKHSDYHLNKTELCEKQEIQLIHIFEDEWNFKQDIVKSRLKNLLGIYDNVVYARKCEVREVNSKESKEFQDKNHIQGSVNSKVSLGLFYENELISLMTFGKCRFDKKHEWEMLRFCNKLGYHIPGAAGKLLAHFEKAYQPKSLVSYADRRWSQGKLYQALGFKLDHVSAPNYWYVGHDYKARLSRIKFQKHKLQKLFSQNSLNAYDVNLSEAQNMKNNGYNKIYDCGNLVFEKILKN